MVFGHIKKYKEEVGSDLSDTTSSFRQTGMGFGKAELGTQAKQAQVAFHFSNACYAEFFH